MSCNKSLDFTQLFFDQLVECFTRNKKPTYVPCPRWIALIMAQARVGYIVNHGVSMPIPVLSSKIINVDTSDGDMHLTQSKESWDGNLYVIETLDSKEEDDEGTMKMKGMMLMMRKMKLTWKKSSLKELLTLP